ncbi:MAG: GIY-YIG nuclease family protein [Proteobacteria bacterium]|nr:GIY-YIG nuclease family protein [Pseudomonadota bacterium]
MAKKSPNYQKDIGWISPDSVDRLSIGPGAYGVLIRLPRRFQGKIGALGEVSLAPGPYLYLGSAYGSGGLPARLRRHVRADKRPHWHVDHLTIAGTVERIFVLPNGHECDLVDCAFRLPAIHAPVTGFGSSDCRRCTAHLLAIPPDSAALMDAFSLLGVTPLRRGQAGIRRRP